MATTREGVELIRGVKVLIKESDLDGERKLIRCETDSKQEFTLRCKVVCDASGPASVIPRHLGLYRKQPEAHRTFNYNSYFAYFRVKEDVPVDFWSYPATRHLCFPEGWAWMISLISWRDTPDENMDQIIETLIDHPEGEDATYPTREELKAKFGGVTEPIVSIGFTIRDDRDVDHLRIEERFNYWVDQYPAIRWVMDHFELIEAPYEGKQRSYSAFMQMAHDVERAAGDGWCAIGDSAMFINPFFSLGMNYGTGRRTSRRATPPKDSTRATFRGRRSSATSAMSKTFTTSTLTRSICTTALSITQTHTSGRSRSSCSSPSPTCCRATNTTRATPISGIRLTRCGLI